MDEPRGRRRGAGRDAGSGSGHRRRMPLVPHRARIERWVAEGYSDGWIASALGSTASSVQSFRSRYRIYRRGRDGSGGAREGAEPPREGSLEEGSPEEGLAFTKGSVSVFEGVLEHGSGEGYGLWLDPAVADDENFRAGFSRVFDVEVSVEEDRIVLTPAGRGDGGGGAREVSARRLESVMGGAAPVTQRGRMKWFDRKRNYGFIVGPSGAGATEGDIYFHGSQAAAGAAPAPGEEVSYELGRNDRGLIARRVRAVDR